MTHPIDIYPGAASAVLQCWWTCWKVSGHHRLDLFMVAGDCCDMDGATALAATLMPEVEVIRTYSGADLATIYQRRGDGWRAYRVDQS